MPVYNEAGIIVHVIDDWIAMLASLEISYTLHVLNDGSTDHTRDVLEGEKERWKTVQIHHKENAGHGPTILMGYRLSCDAPWIFQIDSDNEMKSDAFPAFWEKREDYDFLIAARMDRNAPLSRRIVSGISRLTVHLFYGRGVHDVNSPYRLMRSSFFEPYFKTIPADTFAPNVILTGCAVANNARIAQIPVTFHERQTGEVSIKHMALLRAAIRSLLQTIKYRFR